MRRANISSCFGIVAMHLHGGAWIISKNINNPWTRKSLLSSPILRPGDSHHHRRPWDRALGKPVVGRGGDFEQLETEIVLDALTKGLKGILRKKGKEC